MIAGSHAARLLPRTKPKGRHPQKALSAAFIRSAPPGRHADGNGLYLFVQPSGTRTWIQRRVISRLSLVACSPGREGTGGRFSRILGRGRGVMRCWWPSTSSPVRPEGTRLGSDGAATAGTQPEDRKVRGTVGGVPIGDGSGNALSRARRPRGSLRPDPWQSAEPRLGLGGSRDGR